VLHNVGDGAVAAGSTDAVNGGQLAQTDQNVTNLQTDVTNLTTQVTTNTLAITNLTNLIGTLTGGTVTANPVQYSDATGTPTGGVPSNDVTLIGAAAGPVTVHNVADGQVAAGSTDAVNGGQLYAVAQEVAETRQVADTALALGENSVQYDNPAHDGVTFGDGATPVVLHNVGTGTAPTDAVNVSQLQSGMATAVQTAVGEANAYTDMRLASFGFDLDIMRRDLKGGIAGALAAAGMPQASDPGHSMIALGVGAYQGQQAVAFGFSTRLNDRRTVIRAGASFDTRGRAGGNAGIGFQF
jgi:autotransporter adhesin